MRTVTVDGTLMRWDAAVVFGLALAQRCEKADLVSFSNAWNDAEPSRVFELWRDESLLKSLDRWKSQGYFIGGGTGTRHAFGGLSDAAFRMIPMLEAGRKAQWPWLNRG